MSDSIRQDNKYVMTKKEKAISLLFDSSLIFGLGLLFYKLTKDYLFIARCLAGDALNVITAEEKTD